MKSHDNTRGSHRLIDKLDEERVEDARELLRRLRPRQGEPAGDSGTGLESRRGHHASATFLHQLVDGYPHLYRADRSGPATHGAPRWPVHRPSAGSSHLAGSCSQVSTKSGCLVCTGSTSPAVITSTTRVAPPPSSSTSMTSTPPGPSRALPRARSGCPPDAARPGAAQSPGRPPPSPAEASAGQLAYGRLAGSP